MRIEDLKMNWKALLKPAFMAILCLSIVMLFSSAIMAEEGTETDDDGSEAKEEKTEKQKEFEKMIAKYMEDMTKALDLTEEQVKKITPIIEESRKEMAELREKMKDMDREERRALYTKSRENQEETNKEIKAELTKEQQKPYDEWLEKQRAERRGNRPGGDRERGNRDRGSRGPRE
jgi:Spy/CpxP family protein refolding chaperone